MAYQVGNPILALVGAAASVGNRMFADELFNAEMSKSISSLEPILSEGKFDGCNALTLCQIINDRVQCCPMEAEYRGF